jgi:hypothetical protein
MRANHGAAAEQLEHLLLVCEQVAPKAGSPKGKSKSKRMRGGGGGGSSAGGGPSASAGGGGGAGGSAGGGAGAGEQSPEEAVLLSQIAQVRRDAVPARCPSPVHPLLSQLRVCVATSTHNCT